MSLVKLKIKFIGEIYDIRWILFKVRNLFLIEEKNWTYDMSIMKQI